MYCHWCTRCKALVYANSPKVKLPKISRVQRSTKQQHCKCKSPKGKLSNIVSAKGCKPNIAGTLDLCHFCTCNIWFSTFCTLDILGSLTFGLLHLQYCCLIVLSCLDCHNKHPKRRLHQSNRGNHSLYKSELDNNT